MVILSGCAKTNYELLPLPPLPIAGAPVANELELLCNKNSCIAINNWLNELYLFRKQYNLYRELSNEVE